MKKRSFDLLGITEFGCIGKEIFNWALFKKFCKRDFCDEVRDFKIPEPEAVAS